MSWCPLGNIELQANSTDRFGTSLTSKQVVQVAHDLKASGFSGVLVVTNPVDASQLYQQYTVFKERVSWGPGLYWIQLG